MPIPTNVISLPENVSALPWTGERFLPGVNGQVEMEHIHRYIAAMQLCQDKDVLDIASGEGYGCYMLAQVAKNVVGVDVDPTTIQTATDKYHSDKITFKHGSCAAIPLDDNSIDVVVSFETIEHIKEQTQFIDEVKRVLRPNGIAIISTPDPVIATPLGSPQNEFHIRELYREEFYRMLNKHFKNVLFFGQRSITGSLIFTDGRSVYDKPSEEIFFATGDKLRNIDCVEFFPRPQNIIAIASNHSPVSFASSVYEGIFGTLDALNAAYEYLAKQHEELQTRFQTLAAQYDGLITKQQNADLLSKQHNELSNQNNELSNQYNELLVQHENLLMKFMKKG